MKHTTFLSLIILFHFQLYAQTNKNCDPKTDYDCDGINDEFEQTLALKFAPEWRFNKKLTDPPSGIIDGSNQNLTEIHYPSSVQHIVTGTLKKRGRLPQIQFYYGSSKMYVKDFSDVNQLPFIKYNDTGSVASANEFSGLNGCGGQEITLEFPDDLRGEPNSFPTYFHCGRALNENSIAITYFLFSAYNDVHESFGSHRGDWEWFTLVLKNVDIKTESLSNAFIDYLLFSQHGSTFSYIDGSSARLRLVNKTHPKLFVALGSHAIYPQSGVLENYDEILALYDDSFFGNGLIVQSWRRDLINLGEEEDPRAKSTFLGKAMPNTQWIRYKGRWGGIENILGEGESPSTPACKWSNGSKGNALSWEEWTNPNSDNSRNYKSKWEGIYLDCYRLFSNEYIPKIDYSCSVVIDDRHTCERGGGSTDVKVYGSLSSAIKDPIAFQSSNWCLMPGNFPEPLLIDKKITLRAIEGVVVIGR